MRIDVQIKLHLVFPSVNLFSAYPHYLSIRHIARHTHLHLPLPLLVSGMTPRLAIWLRFRAVLYAEYIGIRQILLTKPRGHSLILRNPCLSAQLSVSLSPSLSLPVSLPLAHTSIHTHTQLDCCLSRAALQKSAMHQKMSCCEKCVHDLCSFGSAICHLVLLCSDYIQWSQI